MARYKFGPIEFEILGKSAMQQNKEYIHKMETVLGIENADNQNRNDRPMQDPLRGYSADDVQIPNWPMPVGAIYDLAEYSDVLKTIINAKRNEVFRNGIIIKEKFATKCNDCGAEFEHPKDQCEKCSSMNLREPDTKQKERLEKFAKKCNENGQSLIEVSKETYKDTQIMDDRYTLLSKSYLYTNEGKIAGWQAVEWVRMHPARTWIMADATGRYGYKADGTRVYVCPEHRTQLLEGRDTCPQCNKQALPAHYRSDASEGEYFYYGEGEVYHRSEYSPSLTYGFPPVLTVWLKVQTLMSQDTYIWKYYAKQRPPRGLLILRTPNMASLEKAWNWMTDQFKKNPHMIPPLAIEGLDQKGDMAKFIDFMASPAEMQMMEMRNEFRRTIGAVYGVMPLFQADTAASGGLNNEGLQITVTNRAVSDGQTGYNAGEYEWLTNQMGITDYILELEPNEEKDEAAEQDLMIKKTQVAQAMQNMGYDVTFTPEGEFEYTPTDSPVQKPGQGMDAFGGGMPPPPMGGDSPPPMEGMPPEQGSEGEADSVPDEMGGSASQDVNFSNLKKNKIYLKPGEMAKDTKSEADKEWEKIKESKETAKYPHKFEAAKWTHSNGHPRCKHCGQEERTGGMCEVLKDAGAVTSGTAGVHNAVHGRRKKDIRRYLHKTLLETAADVNPHADLKKADNEMVPMTDFIQNSLYSGKFDGMSKSISEQIKEYIVRAMVSGYPLSRITEYIQRTTKKNVSQANSEVIARTEMQALQNKAREWAYKQLDPEATLKYKWLNPLDHRTSQICKHIVDRTKSGVSMDELKSIVTEESNKAGLDPREWTPHPNCRSRFLRVRD